MKGHALTFGCVFAHAFLVAVVMDGWAGAVQAQASGMERTFPQSKTTIEKALKEMQPATAGRLPALEGFATSADRPLERYQRGYYQSKFQVSAAPAGGSIVRVSVQVTAWYADPVAAQSGYQVLISNGRLEADLLARPWQQARPGVQVKLLPQDGELYVFAQSRDRVAKERAMRCRQLKWLWKRLAQIAAMKITREELLMKLGAARSQAPTAWRLVAITLEKKSPTFSYRLDRNKLRQARRREGRYLLRTNLTENDPAQLWSYYLQLVAVEEAFKNLKGDLAIRPIFHQDEARVEAHIFIAFLAYCLHVTLGRRLHALAPGLTARNVLAKFAAIQMIDVHVPTTDGRELVLTRRTEPEPESILLLDKLRLELPAQPPPKITSQSPRPQVLM